MYMATHAPDEDIKRLRQIAAKRQDFRDFALRIIADGQKENVQPMTKKEMTISGVWTS